MCLGGEGNRVFFFYLLITHGWFSSASCTNRRPPIHGPLLCQQHGWSEYHDYCITKPNLRWQLGSNQGMKLNSVKLIHRPHSPNHARNIQPKRGVAILRPRSVGRRHPGISTRMDEVHPPTPKTWSRVMLSMQNEWRPQVGNQRSGWSLFTWGVCWERCSKYGSEQTFSHKLRRSSSS